MSTNDVNRNKTWNLIHESGFRNVCEYSRLIRTYTIKRYHSFGIVSMYIKNPYGVTYPIFKWLTK